MLSGFRLGSTRILPLLPSGLVIFSISQFVYFSCVAHLLGLTGLPVNFIMFKRNSFLFFGPEEALSHSWPSQDISNISLLCFAVFAASTHAVQLSDKTILQLETVYKEVSGCCNITCCSVVFQYFFLTSTQKKNNAHRKKRKCIFNPLYNL